ncbi:MAG TPA: hypothetical protein PLS29_09795 [Acidimicrobiales bacterium]|nr:hypothetical protein [Acidimicrobiales bacterium]
MAGGVISSIIVFAVGAILDFAVTASPYQHGVDVRTVGVILMIVGVVGAAATFVLATMNRTGFRHRETVIDDGQGNVVRRDDRIH